MKLHTAMKRRGFAIVSIPTQLGLVLQQVQAWRDFCQLPWEVKSRFAFAHHQCGDFDPGFKVRKGVAEPHLRDRKSLFHFCPANGELLRLYGLNKELQQYPAIQNFFELAMAVHECVFPHFMTLCQDLDSEVPGLVDQLMRGQSQFMYRYLHYEPESSLEPTLAHAHSDRCGMTMPLYQSVGGLELLNRHGEWVRAPMSETKTIIFPSYKFSKLPVGALPSTEHQVLQLAVGGSLQPRISIVLFVPFIDIPNKDENL